MLVGQVVDEEDPGQTLSDLAVLIFTGKEIVDRTLTNRLGEFTFEGAPAEDLRLAVGIRTDRLPDRRHAGIAQREAPGRAVATFEAQLEVRE